MAGYGSGPGYESSMAASNLLGEGISWLWGKLTGSWDSYKKALNRTKMTLLVINAYNGYDKPMQSNGARYRGAYFSGLSGLSSLERDSWTKKYLNEIKGLDLEGKDNVFRNKLFTELFQNSKNPADLEIWKNRKSLTIDQRDALYALKAVGSDLDEMSDFKEKPANFMGVLTSPAYASKLGYVKGQKTLREQASDFLDSKAGQLMPLYELAFSQLDGVTKQKMVEDLDSLSTSISNYYKQYKGTDKLNLDLSLMENLAAKYQAWTLVGGLNFANKQLNKFYQDTVANNQSLWEKTINSGALVIDSASGMFIRAAGMAAGLLTLGRGKEDNGESYWDNVIDNEITRYGDRVSTTNTYDPDELLRLEKLGLSDNLILNTVELQNSLVSWNTPFEVAGQLGFTLMSTAGTFGLNMLVNKGVLLAGMLLKSAAVAGKGLNATAKGILIAKNLIRAKDIGNFLVVGGIAGIEGGMNAALTKRDTYDALSTDIDNKWSLRAQLDIANMVKQHPAVAASLLHSRGYNIQGTLSRSKEGWSKVVYTNDDINRMVLRLSNDDTLIAKYKEAHQKDIDKDKKAAASSAETAMYMDFVGNSIINGFIHSTLQNTLNAPKVQATMIKWRLAKSPFEKEGVSLSLAANGTWKATAKEYTKRAAFKDRLKESLGEGIEEYTLDLSSSFGQGYATDKMRLYINNKYNLHKDGSKALNTDILSGVVAGLSSVGLEAISAEAIKDGLYGGLSTFMGGLNANSHVLSGTRGSAQRLEGESAFDYMSRRNLVGWRSGITPLFSNKETNEVNLQRQQLADNVNKFFSDKNTQDAFFGLTNTSNWMKIQLEAAQHGDEKGVRDAKLGTLVSNVNTLNSLKGTAYYDAVLASLQLRANLNQDNLQDLNSIESQLVSLYKSNLLNKGSEVSDTEALDLIKKSSQGMLSTIQNVENESKEVEKLYGSTIDKDVKESLIFNRLAINDSKDRMDLLDKEISLVQSALGDGETTPISNGAKNLISLFGSISNVEKHVESLNSLIEDTKKLIEDFKNKKDDEDNDPETQLAKSYILLIGQMRLDLLMQEKKAVSKQIETHRDNLSSDVVLTAKDIMSLDPLARATMLDPKNKDKYSKEQQDEIDKVNSVGILQFSDFQSKIQDRGSLLEDYEGAMKGQLSLMLNPEMFNAYTNSVKLKAALTLLLNKYSYLNDYELNGDYSSFAQDLDKVFNSLDSNSQKAVKSMLNGLNSAYFERYKKDRKTLEDLFTLIGESGSLENMDSNDAGMLAHTLTYLSNNGVDLKDESSVVQALSALDEEGNSLLLKYVEDVNQNSLEDKKVVFTSVGEAIQSFKDVMDSYNKLEEEKINNSKPIEVAPTLPEHAAPAQTSFALMASASTEESDKKNKALETQEEKPVSEFEVNSNKKVADAANLGSKVIANSSNTYSSEAKRIALEELNSLGKNEFEDEHELSEALTKKATNLETLDEEDNGDKSQAASLLRLAVSKIEASTVAPISAEAITTKLNVFSRTSENATRTANPNANAMDTLNIAYIKSKYPNGALAKYLDLYKVEDFLRSDFMSDNPPIMFISDPLLALDILQELKSRGYNYTLDNIPLVPVVEVREGGITIKVDGLDRHFQPIGIMPRTLNNNSNGSARLGSIREAILNLPQGELIRDSKGNIIVTSKSGNVVASAPKLLPMTEPNRSALTLQINDLEPLEKELAQKLSKPEFRKTPIYQKMKLTFLSKIGAAKLNGPLAIGYNVSNLKGDNYMFQAFVLPVQQSYDRNSDRLISELFATNDAEAALNSNSRISRAAKELKAFFEAFPSADDMSFELDEQGNIIPTGDTEATLTKLQETLGKKLGNFLNIPSRDGWKYSITPTEKVLPDGRRLFSLSLTSMNGDIIPLGEVTNGTMSPLTLFTILKNLLMDGNTVRMRDNKNSFVVWNVPYIDVQKADNNKRSKDNIADIYDDDILSFSKDSLKYSVNGLAINAPFTMNGEANYFKLDEVSNPSNATLSTSINTPAIVSLDLVLVKNAVVDSETGATLEGEVKAPVKNSLAEAVVTLIVEDSKNIELLPDNSGYINTKTGKKFARVTSIISADEEAGDRFDPNSPWVTPSTNIGTGIDNFVRDFFDGKIDPLDKELSKRYPNATSGDLSRFAQLLEALKNKLNAEGLTIVPRDVTVTGTLKVTDSKGVEYKIDVAGTLDLLAYDGAGNFYVFDMKTNRSGINGHKLEKYTRQLSLYQKFLEENYGVKVKSLQIIPIGVSYPDPKGWRNATAEYDVTKNNQLTLDGNEFRGASPQLLSLIPLNYREPKTIYDKLTDSEKSKIAEKEAKDAALKILEEQSKEGEKPDVQKVEVEESDKENIDPLTGLPIGKVKSRRRRGSNNIEIYDFFNDNTPANKLKSIDNTLVKGKNYTIDKVKELFYKYNTDTQQKLLADRVFEVASKLNLKISFLHDDLGFNIGGRQDGDTIKYSRITTLEINKDKVSQILLHELVHGVTTYVIDAYTNNELENKNLIEAVEMLQDAYTSVKDMGVLNKEYGLTNTKEMIAELANPKFRQELQKINIWDRIKQAIKKIFFFDSPNTVTANKVISTALDKMLDNFDYNLFETYSRTQKVNEDDWNFYRFNSTFESLDAETKEEQEILNKSPRDSQGRLLAPNGKVSNLTERQYAQVRTKAFKRWFGDWVNVNNITSNINKADKSLVDVIPYDKPWKSNPSKINKTLRIYLKDHSKGYFELVKDEEYGIYSVHFKTKKEGAKYNGDWKASTKEDRKILFKELVKLIPEGAQVSTWGELSDEGIIGLNNVGRDMTKVGERVVSSKVTGGEITIPVYQKGDGISKVVDENGEPLVVYHGTNASNITSFSLEKAKHNTGIFLSKSKNVARSYVDWINVDYYGRMFNCELDDFNIYESYDEYKNRTLESEKDEDLPFSGLISEEAFNARKAAIINFNEHIYNTFVNLRNPLIVDAKKRKWNSILFKGVRNTTESLAIYAKKYGYDGVIITNTEDNGLKNQSDIISGYEISDEYIALNPNQLKSATENIGTFSRTNDNIYDTISKLISEKDASVNPKPTRLVPSRLTWGVWEGFTNDDKESIDIDMTLKNLSKFYTEEQWNQLSDEEMEHELKCKGMK